MSESRTDLLNWVNDLLDLSYTKIEQCGTGAAYCQILDSIYGDVPMSRVKFDTHLDYEHLDNYKVLQNMFKKHAIDKPVNVERLSKCKVQDNLEFLQWYKKFWESLYPGGYDPLARRRGAGGRARPGSRAAAAPTPSSSRASARQSGSFRRDPPVSSRAPATRTTAATPVGGRSAAPSRTGVSSRSGMAPSTARARSAAGSPALSTPHATAELDHLKSEVAALTNIIKDIEFERNFYFGKLREIELLAQDRRTEIPDPAAPELRTLDAIDRILVSMEISDVVQDEFEHPELSPALDSAQFDPHRASLSVLGNANGDATEYF